MHAFFAVALASWCCVLVELCNAGSRNGQLLVRQGPCAAYVPVLPPPIMFIVFYPGKQATCLRVDSIDKRSREGSASACPR